MHQAGDARALCKTGASKKVDSAELELSRELFMKGAADEIISHAGSVGSNGATLWRPWAERIGSYTLPCRQVFYYFSCHDVGGAGRVFLTSDYTMECWPVRVV